MNEMNFTEATAHGILDAVGGQLLDGAAHRVGTWHAGARGQPQRLAGLAHVLQEVTAAQGRRPKRRNHLAPFVALFASSEASESAVYHFGHS